MSITGAAGLDRGQVTGKPLSCGRGPLTALLLAFLLCVSAREFTQAAQAAPQPPAAAGGTPIYIVRRGWHIDIGFAVADIGPPLEFMASDFPGARYLFFGFGDRRYLLAKHHYGPALLEALWPGPGLILATAIAGSPSQAFGAVHVVALSLTDSQLRSVQRFVRQSFEQDNPAAYAAGPYDGSFYYEAAATYSGLHTCNTWAAETLNAAGAGVPVHSAHVLFAGQLWRQVQVLKRRQTPILTTQLLAHSAGN